MSSYELWLRRRDGGWRAQLRGHFQKVALKRTLNAWQPIIAQTTNETYQQRLARIGVSARKLPLPSNVPLCDRRGSNWFEQQIGFKSPEDAARHWVFGIFGTVHPEWDGAAAVESLVQLARDHDRAPLILSIGRNNSRIQRWKQLQQKFGERVVRSPLGEQPLAYISEFLQKIDFGLSTNPLALIGKSTSVAAMLEHGLPVIVFRLEGENRPPPLYRAEQIIPADETLSERISGAKKLQAEDRLLIVAQEFLDAFR